MCQPRSVTTGGTNQTKDTSQPESVRGKKGKKEKKKEEEEEEGKWTAEKGWLLACLILLPHFVSSADMFMTSSDYWTQNGSIHGQVLRLSDKTRKQRLIVRQVVTEPKLTYFLVK